MSSITGSGSRLSQCAPGLIGVLCERCRRCGIHDITHFQKSLPRTTPLDALRNILTPFCPLGWNRDGCEGELISPDDGVAVNG